MHPRLFRLLETHQRIDEQLSAARRHSAADGREVERLRALKMKAKQLIGRLMPTPALLPV